MVIVTTRQPLERILTAVFFEYGLTWDDSTLAQFAYFVTRTVPIQVYPNRAFDGDALRRYEREHLARLPTGPLGLSRSDAIDTHIVRVRLEAGSGYILDATQQFGQLFDWLDSVSAFFVCLSCAC